MGDAVTLEPTFRLRVPAAPGTYVFWMRSGGAEDIRVGRLGPLRTRPGVYAYVGSARGPGGLRARLRHHCKVSPKPRWHVDHLRRVLAPEAVWYTCDRLSREHDWARLFAATRGASLPLAGFGASDCRCSAHLFFFETRPGLSGFRKRAGRRLAGHAPIRAVRLAPDGSVTSGGAPRGPGACKDNFS